MDFDLREEQKLLVQFDQHVQQIIIN